MSKFTPGKSGNVGGRPSKEEMALRRLEKGELHTVVDLLGRAAPKAVKNLIAAMDDTEIPKKDRLRHSKEVFDMYVKATTVNNALKKDNAGLDSEDENEDNDDTPAVVFKIAG